MAGATAQCEPNWQRQQRRAFSRWVDSQLELVGAESLVSDLPLEQRFQDGLTLPRLMESLSGKLILRTSRQMQPKGPAGRADNIFQTMSLIKDENVKLVCVAANDVLNGQTKMILGLVWALIKRYLLASTPRAESHGLTAKAVLNTGKGSKIHATFQTAGESKDRDKELLLEWANTVLESQGIAPVKNFTTDWQNGTAFCTIENYLNSLSGFPPLDDPEPEDVFIEAAVNHQIPRLLEPEDLVDLDEKIVMLYVACFRKTAQSSTRWPIRRNQSFSEGGNLFNSRDRTLGVWRRSSLINRSDVLLSSPMKSVIFGYEPEISTQLSPKAQPTSLTGSELD